MLKYLVLLILAVAVYRWLKSRQAHDTEAPSAAPAPETMVRCAHCGIHLPQTETLRDGDDFYCSEPHRRLGKG